MKKKLYYSTKELSEMFGVSRQEIVRRIWVGQIKAYKVAGAYIIHHTQVKKLKRKKK